MITREDIIGESRRLGFGDVGFTTAEPFTAHLDYLRSHQAEYGWVEKAGLALLGRDGSEDGAACGKVHHRAPGALLP